MVDDQGAGRGLLLVDGAARRTGSAVAITAVVVAITLGLTGLVSIGAWRIVQAAEQERLDERAADALTRIDRRMQAYTESIFGGQALFATSDVTRAEYRTFVNALELPTRYPGIQVLGHATHVLDRERPQYDAITAADAATTPGYPDFEPYVPGPDRTPVTGHDEYLVIDYVEPTVGNEAAFGLDFFSEGNRRTAAELTRDTGQPATSAPVVLVQETGSQSGFLVMRAIYDVDDPSELETVQDRRRAFTGVQYAAFRMGDLIEGVLGEGPATSLEIYDVGTPGSTVDPSLENQTYSDTGGARAVDAIDPTDARLETFDFGGRRWLILVDPVASVLNPIERFGPLALLLGGLLITAFASAGVWSVATARERAVGIAQEMTHALRESEEELARSNQELERFAYVASHDLQEPLRTVSSFVGLLDMQYGEQMDDRAREYMHHVRDGARRMSVLIAELLDYSRAGRDIHVRPVDLDEVLQGVLRDLRAGIDEAGATVTAGPMPTVMAEPTAMIQVLSNLLSNALKYRSTERPSRIQVAAERAGRVWKISVTDNGIGIDPQYHDEVFVMLRRLHSRTEYPGTGMGLAIAKKHVVAAGGTMSLTSAPDEGSTFTFTIPAADGESPGGGPQTSSRRASSPSAAST